jgi:hypothetical protein
VLWNDQYILICSFTYDLKIVIFTNLFIKIFMVYIVIFLKKTVYWQYNLFLMRPSRSWSYCSWLHTTLCDKVCHWLAMGWWFSLCTLVTSTNETNRHDIIEILLKVAFNTINHNHSFLWRKIISFGFLFDEV